MGFVGLKTNSKEEKEIEELEILLRSMDPSSRIGSRSAAIKEAVRISLFYLKNTYFYKQSLTNKKIHKKGRKHNRPTTIIQSNEIGIDGRRHKK